MDWWVSQATSLRRLVVKGSLSLGGGGWCSGGFVANSIVTGKMEASGQQQWFSRNTEIGDGWSGWPSIFNLQVGNTGNLDETKEFVSHAPIIAEKPFLVYENNEVMIHIPPKVENASGPDHSEINEKLVVTEDMLVKPSDTAASIKTKLKEQNEQHGWKALVVLPGEYDQLDGTIVVDTLSNVVLLGLGFATLIGHEFGPCLEVVDNGKEIRTSGFLFHQGGGDNTDSLIKFEPISDSGVASSTANFKRIFFHDIFCRTGGPKANLGTVDVMMQVNAASVVGDNSWLWTADHGLADKAGNPYRDENGGKFVDWYANHGLIVNGSDFVQYGLFSEHHKSHMVWFKGENAQVFFYQSELPYAEFDTTKFAYLVEPSVATHTAIGIGTYFIFYNYPLSSSKPNYDAGMSISTSTTVKDLIAMEWHQNHGADHALKVGNEFQGESSTFGQVHFVSYGGDAVATSDATARRSVSSSKLKNVTSGAPWPFSIFCGAQRDVDA
jgi:hypothetical protein